MDNETIGAIEFALDRGLLGAKMRNGNTWKMRRNGMTQRWKKDPKRFRIPFKCGLKTCGALTEADLVQIEGRWMLNPNYYEYL